MAPHRSPVAPRSLKLCLKGPLICNGPLQPGNEFTRVRKVASLFRKVSSLKDREEKSKVPEVSSSVMSQRVNTLYIFPILKDAVLFFSITLVATPPQ